MDVPGRIVHPGQEACHELHRFPALHRYFLCVGRKALAGHGQRIVALCQPLEGTAYLLRAVAVISAQLDEPLLGAALGICQVHGKVHRTPLNQPSLWTRPPVPSCLPARISILHRIPPGLPCPARWFPQAPQCLTAACQRAPLFPLELLSPSALLSGLPLEPLSPSASLFPPAGRFLPSALPPSDFRYPRDPSQSALRPGSRFPRASVPPAPPVRMCLSL